MKEIKEEEDVEEMIVHHLTYEQMLQAVMRNVLRSLRHTKQEDLVFKACDTRAALVPLVTEDQIKKEN